MHNEIEISDCIIISNDFPLPKENEKIKFLKFFDLSSKKVLTFVQHEKKYFIVLSKKMFGSAFLGNLVISNPKYLIIKKFDTLILLINILYVCGPITNQSSIDTDTIISTYMEQMEKQKREEEEKDKKNNKVNKRINYNNYKEETRSFIAEIIKHNIDRLNMICEITKNEDDTFSFLLIQSKVYEYLNSKVNLNEIEDEEIKNNCKKTENYENEQKELSKRKLKEKSEIIGQFLPQELVKQYRDYKGININSEVQKSNEENELKKKVNKTQNKSNKKKKADKQIEISKGQLTINFYMKKKE